MILLLLDQHKRIVEVTYLVHIHGIPSLGQL